MFEICQLAWQEKLEETVMRSILKVFHATVLVSLCWATASAQKPVDFDKMWADCNLVCKPRATDKFFHHEDYEARMQKAMEISGILNELGAMRDNFLKTGDFKDLFPTLYFNTTRTEFNAILNDEMSHPIDKMNMMENFYDAFKLNRIAFEKGGVAAVEHHWRHYYQGVSDIYRERKFSRNDVRHLINDAIYAHVKYDLPRAIRDSVNRSQASKVDLKSDFDKTNPFFDVSASLSNDDINNTLYNGNPANRFLLAVGSVTNPHIGSDLGITNIVDRRNDAWQRGNNNSMPLLTSEAQPRYEHPMNRKYLPESLKKGICFALTNEGSYTVGAVWDTEKTACRTDIIKQTSSGSVSFGDWAGRAGPNGFGYPKWTAYNFSDLRQYKHGELLLNIGDKIVGGGTSSEKMSDADGEIRLIINDADYSNNDGEFSVKIKLSGYRLYKFPF